MRALPRSSAERAAICEALVERYTPLVQACVRPYRRSPEPVEDLMQVGYMGLLKAINNFDPQVGDSLSAYATPCVSGEIKRHFRDKRWQIHVRRSIQELLLQMRAAAAEMTQELGRGPADDELAAVLGVTEDDIREARQAELAFSAYSLDAPLSGHEEDTAMLADVLGEDDQAVEHAIDIESVHAHLDELPERERRILALRFYGNFTQAEIGQRLGISQMHVSRLLSQALTYLREQLTCEPGEDRKTPRRFGTDPSPISLREVVSLAEELGRDEHEGHRDPGDELWAEIIARVLHARQQGDDHAAQDGEKQGPPGHPEAGVVAVAFRGRGTQVRQRDHGHRGHDQAADEVRGQGDQPQPHQLEPRADGALIGDVAGPAVHGHPGPVPPGRPAGHDRAGWAYPA